MSEWSLDVQPLGVIMERHRMRPHEDGGVTHPTGIEGADGRYYLFPVYRDNLDHTRIGLACVRRATAGTPYGVLRLDPPYTISPSSRLEIHGIDHPHITALFSPSDPYARRYVMIYAAYGPKGVHLAKATSSDMYTWHHAGLVQLERSDEFPIRSAANTHGILVPDGVRGPYPDPSGRRTCWAQALLHHPFHRGHAPALYISYLDVFSGRFGDHAIIAQAQEKWECAGIAPRCLVRVADNYVLFYSGHDAAEQSHCGAMLLDRRDPRHILKRTTTPILEPGQIISAAQVRDGGLDVYYSTNGRIEASHLSFATNTNQERDA